MRRPWQLYAVAALVIAAGVAAVLAPAITRDPSFHAYADRRGWLGVPNAGDVLSNLPFVLVGVVGLTGIAGFGALHVPRRSPLVVALFVSLVGVGLGSGAYHAAPGDPALALDWAPIVLTLAFLAALVVGDRVDRTAGLAAAVGLPVIALVSVAVWYVGGGTGTGAGTGGGDMRWYVITQAALVTIIAAAALVPPAAGAPASLDRRWLLAGVAGFLAARGMAAADAALLDRIGVSGHSAKHLVLGLAAACLIPSLHVQRGEGARAGARRTGEARRRPVEALDRGGRDRARPDRVSLVRQRRAGPRRGPREQHHR